MVCRSGTHPASMRIIPVTNEIGPVTEQTLTAADGASLRLRIARAQMPKGSIIVVHGIDDHLGRYGPLVRFLSQNGYDTYAYDQRGHGHSSGARNDITTFWDYVSDLERVHDMAQRANPTLPQHIFGHSMGAVVVLLALTRYPDKWRSAILQGCPLALRQTLPRWVEVLGRAVGMLFPRLRTRTGIEAEQLTRDTAVVDEYRRDPHVAGKVTLRWGVEFLDALEHVRDRAQTLRTPLLILHGEADRVANAAGSRWLFENAGSKDNTLLTYPDLRHELHNELAPDRVRVFGDILTWLERH